MSHTAEAKTKIRTVNEGVLQAALELINRVTPGLKIEGTQQANQAAVKTYGGGNVACDVALFTPTIKHGLGLRFRGKEGLEFVMGDVDNSGHSAMQSLILMTYQMVAAQRALEMIKCKRHEVVASNDRAVRIEAYMTA